MQESCPRCGARMKETREPLRIRGIYVGAYDSMSCPICKYYYFTEEEYDLALYNARSIGVIGPPLSEIGSILTTEKLSIEPIFHIDRPSNSISEIDKKEHAGHLTELPPVTISHDILAPTGLDTGR